MKSRLKQQGFTLVEIVFVLGFIVAGCLAAAGLYVLFHFIHKFW